MEEDEVRAEAPRPSWGRNRFAAALLGGEVLAVIAAGAYPLAGIAVTLLMAPALLLAARRCSGRCGNVLLVVFSLTVATAFVEGAAVWLRKDIRLVGEPALFDRGGPLGWTLRPGTHHVEKTINGRTIYAVDYRIDAGGHRQMSGADRGPIIAFLGDSFTFGEGIEDQDTLPQAFADLTGRKMPVRNLGVPAYSPAQVLRELELGLYDSELQPAKAFFMLTAAWHVDRVACADDWVVGAPRYVSIDGRAVANGQCPPLPALSPLVRFVRSTSVYKALFDGHLPFVSDDDIENYINVVVEIGRIARQKYGVPLRVLYLRNAGYLRFSGFTDDAIIGRLQYGGVKVYDTTLPHEGKSGFAIAGDGHPNGVGNRLRAQMLLDALARNDPGLLAE